MTKIEYYKLLPYAVVGSIVAITVAIPDGPVLLLVAGLVGAAGGAAIGAAFARVDRRSDQGNQLELHGDSTRPDEEREVPKCRAVEPDWMKEPPPVTNAMRLLARFPSRDDSDTNSTAERYDL